MITYLKLAHNLLESLFLPVFNNYLLNSHYVPLQEWMQDTVMRDSFETHLMPCQRLVSLFE